MNRASDQLPLFVGFTSSPESPEVAYVVAVSREALERQKRLAAEAKASKAAALAAAKSAARTAARDAASGQLSLPFAGDQLDVLQGRLETGVSKPSARAPRTPAGRSAKPMDQPNAS